MTLARINGLRTVWLEAAVPEVHAGMLVVGRPVEARFAAYPGQVSRERSRRSCPEANRADAHAARAHGVSPIPRQRLKPGMFAQVHIAGEKRGSPDGAESTR